MPGLHRELISRRTVLLGGATGLGTAVLGGALSGCGWAAEVKERFDEPASPTVATELVAASITSGGDGSETEEGTAGILADNPHIRFYNNRRSYVRTRFTDGEMRADFQIVPYVSRPGAPVQTRASFAVPDGQPGLQPA